MEARGEKELQIFLDLEMAVDRVSPDGGAPTDGSRKPHETVRSYHIQ